MKIYTIGHSTHTIDNFVVLAKNCDVNIIVDVRSSPYSRYNPQFNMEYLKNSLNQEIHYLYMGDLLGARYNDKELLFDNGKVDFKKVQRSASFQQGIKRLRNGIMKGYIIALMCSEKDALDCHRFALISEYLSHMNFEIYHIMPDNIYTHKDLETKLVEKYFKKLDLVGLSTSLSPLEQAYEFLNFDIAYIERKLDTEQKFDTNKLKMIQGS